MPEWKKRYPGVETLNVAVMGCIVNGPGESKHADIGISLPGTGETPAAPVFIDGKKAVTLRGADGRGRVQADGDRLYRAPLRPGRGRAHRGGVTSGLRGIQRVILLLQLRHVVTEPVVHPAVVVASSHLRVRRAAQDRRRVMRRHHSRHDRFEHAVR